MLIDTKFDIGENIYAVRLINNRTICDLCKGKKTFYDSFKVEYSCPKCQGGGYIMQGLKYQTTGPYNIIGIKMSFEENDYEEIVEEEIYLTFTYEKDSDIPIQVEFCIGEENLYLFSSRASAKNKCDSLNKRLKNIKIK